MNYNEENILNARPYRSMLDDYDEESILSARPYGDRVDSYNVDDVTDGGPTVPIGGWSLDSRREHLQDSLNNLSDEEVLYICETDRFSRAYQYACAWLGGESYEAIGKEVGLSGSAIRTYIWGAGRDRKGSLVAKIRGIRRR